MKNDETTRWDGGQGNDEPRGSREFAEEHFRTALHLIKLHMTEQHTPQNVDLHNAVQHLVRGARLLGLLNPDSGSTRILDTIL